MFSGHEEKEKAQPVTEVHIDGLVTIVPMHCFEK